MSTYNIDRRTGLDTNDGSSGNPKRTLATMSPGDANTLSLIANDVVIIAAESGEYINENIPDDLPDSVTVRSDEGVDAADRPVLNGATSLDFGFGNVDVTSGGDRNGVTIRDLIFKNFKEGGIAIIGDSSLSNSIINCQIKDIWNGLSVATAGVGIGVGSTTAASTTITDCDVRDCAGDGIHGALAGTFVVTDCWVEDNGYRTYLELGAGHGGVGDGLAFHGTNIVTVKGTKPGGSRIAGNWNKNLSSRSTGKCIFAHNFIEDGGVVGINMEDGDVDLHNNILVVSAPKTAGHVPVGVNVENGSAGQTYSAIANSFFNFAGVATYTWKNDVGTPYFVNLISNRFVGDATVITHLNQGAMGFPATIDRNAYTDGALAFEKALGLGNEDLAGWQAHLAGIAEAASVAITSTTTSVAFPEDAKIASGDGARDIARDESAIITDPTLLTDHFLTTRAAGGIHDAGAHEYVVPSTITGSSLTGSLTSTTTGQDISATQGATHTVVVTVPSLATVWPEDVSTATWTAKHDPDAPDATLSKTKASSDFTVDLSAETLTFTLSSTDIAIKPEEYSHEMEIVDADSNTRLLFRGVMTIVDSLVTA